MRTQVFSLALNPKQWVVPPVSVIRARGKWVPKFGRDQSSEDYKQAVQEELKAQGLEMFSPGYRLEFFTARRIESYQSAKSNRTIVKKRVDATNMQKLIEDSFQDFVIGNDRDVLDVRTAQLEQSRFAVPAIVVVLRSGIEIVEGGLGYDPSVFPTDVRIECERALQEARMQSASRLTPNLDISDDESNRW